MDLNEIWQEHKRFIVTAVAGLLVFVIGNSIVESMYRGDIAKQKGRVTNSANKLKGELYTTSDRALAEKENELLQAGFAEMVEAVAFEPRPGFTTDSGPTAMASYETAVEGLRDRLSDLASRNRARLVDGLGIEALTTSNVDEVERQLHAVDLLERTIALALEAGVRRVSRVTISLDPAFKSRRGVEAIERTKVEIDTVSTAESVTEWIALTQTPLPATGEGTAQELIRRQPLPIQDLEMSRVSAKEDEVRTSVTFLVVRIHELEDSDEDE